MSDVIDIDSRRSQEESHKTKRRRAAQAWLDLAEWLQSNDFPAWKQKDELRMRSRLEVDAEVKRHRNLTHTKSSNRRPIMADVSLELSQSGSESSSIRAVPGDTISLKLPKTASKNAIRTAAASFAAALHNQYGITLEIPD